MRILVTGLGRMDQLPGGSARYMSGLSDALRRAGHDVLEITGTDLFDARLAAASGVFAQVVRALVRSSVGLPRGAAAVARFRPDVVTVHFPLDGLGATLAAGWSGVPVVSHFHGPWASEAIATGRRGRWPLSTDGRRELELLVYRRAGRSVTLSNAFADLLASDYSIPRDSINVVPGGIDSAAIPAPDRLDPVASRRGLRLPERPTIVTVRRLVPRTGVDLAIEALAHLVHRHRDLDPQLVVAGDGPELGNLRDLARTLGVADRTVFLGRFPDEQLWLIHGAADVCVVPSRALEGFGYGALEGLAAGRPTIVTKIGGLTELVAPICPRWVVAPTASAIADGIADILLGLSAYPPPAALRSYADQFDWGGIALRVVDVYRSALSDGSRDAKRGRARPGPG